MTKKFFVFLLLAYLQSFRISQAAKKLPDYVTICKRNDPNLSKCWRDSLNSLKPYLLKGIPEFNIPPIDPLLITEISLNQEPRSDRIHFNATLTNLEFSEGQNFEILDNAVDMAKITFYLKLRFPHLTMKSDYRAKGRVLVFDFDSDGKAFGEFDDVTVATSWTGSTFTRKGKEYITLKEDKVDVNVGKIQLRFDDIIKGNPQLSKNVNLAINDNIDLLYADFLPLLRQTLGTIITQYTNRAYRAFPMDVLYPTQ